MFSTADEDDFTLSSWSALTDTYAAELRAFSGGDTKAASRLNGISRRLERYRLEMAQRERQRGDVGGPLPR